MQNQQLVQTFLDIFVIINNSSLMPEVFTMIVSNDSGENKGPQFPKNIKYQALPIGGVPATIRPEDQYEAENYQKPNTQSYLTPSIFYLEDGIMLFFRVPITDDSLEKLFTDNYFGPNDFTNNSDLPMFFL